MSTVPSGLRISAVGLLGGLAGITLVWLYERVERAALGEWPVYSARRVAERMAATWLHVRDPAVGRRAGPFLRAAYGSGLGVGFAVTRDLLPRRPLAAAVVTATAITGLELGLLPTVHATPPIRAWPKRQLLLLGPHALAFAIGASLVISRFRPGRTARRML